MKRLLTKTLCLQAILFMGIAFSTSCKPSTGSSSDTEAEPELIVNSLKSGLKYINTRKNYTFTYSGKNLVDHTYTFTRDAVGISSSSKKELNHFYYSDLFGTFEIEYLDSKYITSEYRSDKNVWDTNLTFTFLDVGTDFVNSVKDTDTEVRIKNNDYKRTFVQMMGYTPDDFMSIDSLTVAYKSETNTLEYVCTMGSREYKYIASNFGDSEIPELKESTLRAYEPSSNIVSAREAMKSNNYVQSIYNFSESGNGYVGNYIFNPHYFAQTYNSSTTMTGYVSLNCEEDTSEENAHPALKGCYYTVVENYATNPKPSINSNPISQNPNIVEVMNYPNNLKIWSNFHRTMGWSGTSTEELIGKGYYTDDSEILTDFSNNYNMDGSFQGQKPNALGIDIKVTSGSVESIVFYYYFMYGATKMCYPIPIFNFGKANVKILDQIYSVYHTIED